MCKILIIKGIENSSLALDFMNAVAPNMSEGNTDGIGYSAINSKNQLFSEKWHKNKHFMNTNDVLDKATMEALEPFKNRLPSNVTQNYAKYGNVTRDDLRTVTMHTRFATCGKEFANTHPFIDKEMSLIHNGSISNCNELMLNKVSTCDSENALQLYINMNMNLQESPEMYQSYIDQLKGSWALGILAKNAAGVYMIDIVRERSSLVWSMFPELGDDCLVFATTQSIIEKGCTELGLPPRDKIFSLSESNYHRFNAVTGEFIDNYILAKSKLNDYTPVFDYDSWYKGKYGRRNYTPNMHIVDQEPVFEKKPDISQDDMYEGYQLKKIESYKSKVFRDQMQGLVDDDMTFEAFYDTEALLIDRLYEYDIFMGSKFGEVYEDLPAKTKLFIERKEEEDYIVFDIIIEMLEKYAETKKIESIFTIFKNKKRA